MKTGTPAAISRARLLRRFSITTAAAAVVLLGAAPAAADEYPPVDGARDDASYGDVLRDRVAEAGNAETRILLAVNDDALGSMTASSFARDTAPGGELASGHDDATWPAATPRTGEDRADADASRSRAQARRPVIAGRSR